MFWKFSVFLKFLRFAESWERKIKIKLVMIRWFSACNLDKMKILKKSDYRLNIQPVSVSVSRRDLI